VPGHGQPGLAAPDHNHIQPLTAGRALLRLVVGGGHWSTLLLTEAGKVFVVRDR
jgi:hypothetical protein